MTYPNLLYYIIHLQQQKLEYHTQGTGNGIPDECSTP